MKSKSIFNQSVNTKSINLNNVKVLNSKQLLKLRGGEDPPKDENPTPPTPPEK